MERVFLAVFNNGVSASFLVLAVLLLRLLLKRAPKSARCALWAVVGLRLALPFRLRSGLSLVPSARTVSPDIVYAARPAIDSGISAVDRAVNPALGASLAATPQASANPMQIVLFIAAWVWLIGVVLLLVSCLVSALLLRHRLAQSVPLRENIRLCERVASPFVLGVLKPGIYLPVGMEEPVMALAIAHEQAHISRGDHAFKLLGYLLLAVYWFNPLLWLGYVLLCRDMELACDERVLKSLGPEMKKDYSRALLACSAPQRLISACPVAFGENDVNGRIRSILSYKKPPLWIGIAAACVCAALAVCFLTDPVERDPEKLYAQVLERYYTAAREKWTEEQLVEAGMNPALSRYSAEYVQASDKDRGLEQVGYLFRDLDGDGTQELILGYRKEYIRRYNIVDDYYRNQLLDVYTLKNGQAVRLPLSGSAFLRADGQIHSQHIEDGRYEFRLYALKDGAWTMTESLMYPDEQEFLSAAAPHHMFYYTDGEEASQAVTYEESLNILLTLEEGVLDLREVSTPLKDLAF